MSLWRAAYSALAFCALPFAIWRVHRRARGAKAPPPLREYFGKISAHDSKKGPVVWVHSVSVGEAAAAAELIRELRKRRPQCEWILTHTTIAGREKLESDFGGFARVAACPLDLPGATREFIRRAKPDLAILMEAEYWPNLIAAASDSGAKILLANARMGRKNARQYAKAAPLTREIVSRLDSVAAQTRGDLRRLRFFGAKNGVVSGNLKFDRAPDDAQVKRGASRRAKLRECFGARPVVLFASVREGEGEMLIRAMDDSFLRNHFCVFAPRHPERCGGIVSELRSRGIRFSRASQGGEVGKEGERVGAHLADSLGEMAAHYAMCDAAFVGGGLAGGFGGQNPIEAMTQGVAAIAGPDSANYAALTRSAERSGALLMARDAGDAVRLLRKLCADDGRRRTQGELARKFCEGRRGALKIAADLAEGLLSESPPTPPSAPVGG